MCNILASFPLIGDAIPRRVFERILVGKRQTGAIASGLAVRLPLVKL